jgi:hypothetical protein
MKFAPAIAGKDEAQRVNRSIFCGYQEAMWACEELADGPLGMLQTAYLRTAAAHHEAGHAVVGYALGLGLPSVSLRYIQQGRNTSFGGLVPCSKTWVDGLILELLRYRQSRPNNWRGRAVSDAVSSAAGPAAERKFCIETETPLRLSRSAESDHERIDLLGKTMGKARFALRRFAWRRAQLAIEHPAVWDAISEIAQWLDEAISCNDRCFDDDVLHGFSMTMAGATARSIARRNGVRPGLRLWPESGL